MLQSNNNRISSGLPHSEIEGSKLILSSPSLIAEYHVLHRLLLPRHPPNALIALDLIQKEPNCAAPCDARHSDKRGLLRPPLSQSEPKALYVSRSECVGTQNILVSVLDLDSLMLRDLAITDLPPLGDVSMTLICFSLNDVKYDLTIACVQQDDQTYVFLCSRPGRAT